MRILFATHAPLRQGPAGATSDLASVRYRMLIPATQLARLGHGVQIASLPQGPWPPAVRDAACDVMVLSKWLPEDNLPQVAAMRARGVRVVADFCDDHHDHPEFASHQKRLLDVADTLVASTPAMAEALRGRTGREVVVIGDPVEGPRAFPKFAPQLPALRVLWFGHHTNLGGLAAKAAELRELSETMPVRLTVVTSPSPQAQAFVAEFVAPLGRRVAARYVPWTLEGMWKAFEEADLVWIPIDASQRKVVKSPNRLVESLWAGRFVVADAIPSYEPFADLVPIGQPLPAAVLAALEDPKGVEKRLGEAQRRVARDHSAYACGIAWAAALGDAGARSMRLNLGCGDKILPGYVNVDVVESRAGKKPDVICDLHDLAPFADASADEILSVHVVEHFWRWEVRDVLREWVRVLKPGGRMVIECPNLESACRTFLEDPVQRAREDKEGQRTMWVFYGDPAWKDPLMNHRWGYTPGSLQSLLSEVGLANVRQEPAQFKLREPRDMRVVGTKPA